MTEPHLLLRLGVALVLCSLIGLEREIRQKSAGLRTHTLVGLGAAVAMIVSKHGFADVIDPPNVVLDPSRVASTIVSGIGFIGAGLIFVRRDTVRGLTTAAVVWLTAMVGMAAGAGLLLIASAGTVGHFVVVGLYPALARRLPRSKWTPSAIRLIYRDGQGILRRALTEVTERGFTVGELQVDRPQARPGEVAVVLQITGKGSIAELTSALSQFDGVVQVHAGEGEGEAA